MKVNANQISNAANVTGNSGTAKSKSAGAEALGAKASDQGANLGDSAKINISEKAQMAAKVKELATPDMNTVREDKVAQLQRMIDEGRYDVSASAIADRLVDEHLIN